MSIRPVPPPDGAPSVVHQLLSRNSLIVGAALLLLVMMAWIWLLSMPDASMADMAGTGMADMPMGGMPMAIQPLSPSYFLAAFAMWSIMMVAMMLPSAAPMILLHARIDRATSCHARLLHSLMVMGSYLLIWTSFSAIAAGAQALLLHGGYLSAATLSLGGRLGAAGLLLVAALYELTTAKHRCLENCQSPLIFIHRYRRPGAGGAFQIGMRHGLYCLGCCWALMLLLFVGGVMNLAWIAFFTCLVAAQKMAPPRWRLDRWTAAFLFLAALFVALR